METTMANETIEALADAHEALAYAYSILDRDLGGDGESEATPDQFEEASEAMEVVDKAMAMVAPLCGRT